MFWSYHPAIFTQQFCADILSNAKDFEAASVNVYGRQQKLNNVRNNDRLEFIDAELTQKIQDVILKHDFPYLLQEKNFSHFNDHLRIYRYVPGQFFKPHKDGHIKSGDNTSLITILLYLNDTVGGETILMPQGFAKKEVWQTITPTVGSVLLFEHADDRAIRQHQIPKIVQ